MQTYKLIDSGGKRASFSMTFVSGTADVAAFLTKWSGLGLLSATESTPQAITMTTPTAGFSLARRLIARYRTIVSGIHSFQIPAPTRVGTLTKQGERLSLADAQAVVDAHKACDPSDTVVRKAIRAGFVQVK